MAEFPNTPDDLYPFAKALVRRLIRLKELNWTKQRKEDAAQELFLAGWQVYCDTGEVGLAKNRMVSRVKNLYRDYRYEVKHEPKAESQKRRSRQSTNDEEAEDKGSRHYDDPTKRSELRADQDAESAVRDMIDQMSERQQAIVKLRMAAFTNEEIAEELGIGLRTVERELLQLRKDYANDE